MWYHGKESEGRPDHHHLGVYGLPGTQLRDAEKSEERSGAAGASEVLPAMPPTSGASRDAVSRGRPGRHRVVAQVAEQRSPKPQVGGSSPSGPAESPDEFSAPAGVVEGLSRAARPFSMLEWVPGVMTGRAR